MLASLDAGCEKRFIAHRSLLGAGIYGVENINSQIDFLPASGFTLVVMPLKITGGSGAPARVVAMLPASPTSQDNCLA
jgi:kynurenine formamidase